ncbi:hypothetical protein [Flavobacterium sp. NRK1]|uniref:hypothetical protein n=1 Tax=Flavobacterium sp. NRK1 TaxID=2954929 RepID=UPI0020936F33|nr:hypothetical protein [Flavobacterium sp. NRK1]MCO6147761.1 hypothetical protein [Flavobacterium sp. NRK1]
MKNPFIYLFAVFMTAASLTSCSGDDDKGSVSSREIKYEITGNYSGSNIDVTYTENGGGTTTEVSQLPWSMTYTADNDTYAGGFSASAIDAAPGEKIKLSVYQGSKLKKSIEGTADSDGIIVASVSASFD